MDGIHRMKPLWMIIMALNMLVQLVVQADNPLALFLSPNSTSSPSPSPLFYHPLYNILLQSYKHIIYINIIYE